MWGALASIAIQKAQSPPRNSQTAKAVGLFPAGLSATLQFTDIDLLAAAIRNWNHEGIQLEPGAFRSRLDLVHTAAMQIHRVQLSPAILVRGLSVPGSIVFGVQTGGTNRAKWRGRTIASDDVVTFDGRAEIDFQTTGASEITVVSVDRQLFEQHAIAICGKSLPRASAGDRLKISSPPGAESLIRTWAELIDSSLTLGAQLADDHLARHFEDKILEVLLSNVSEVDHKPGITERRCIAHRARQYMVLNMDEPMTITEICTAIGAAERTLQLGFRECFGLNPKKFLKLLRLNAAHRSLQHPEPGTTVTAVALRWGFFHLARFAGEYRQLFDETPSTTLRRVAGSRRFAKSP